MGGVRITEAQDAILWAGAGKRGSHTRLEEGQGEGTLDLEPQDGFGGGLDWGTRASQG